MYNNLDLLKVALFTIIISSLYYRLKHKEGFETEKYATVNTNNLQEPQSLINGKSIEIVVSRYNEDVSYLDREPFSKYRQIVYNKGPKPVNCSKCQEIKLANVGRETHSYLYHIITNYNNLRDITIFLPGSCMDKNKYNKDKKTKYIFDNLQKEQDSMFICLKYKNVRNDLYNFTIEDYLHTNKENQQINSKSMIQKANIRPFGKWFDILFGDIRVTGLNHNGIFAVSKKHILQHPKEYYENLITHVNGSENPESGHFFERSWLAVFDPVPAKCIKYYQ